MTKSVTLTMPGATLEKANRWAKLTGIPVGDLLAEAIDISLAPETPEPDLAGSMETWSDEAVLAACGTHQDQLFRKARALREAVRRGLREPLQS